MHVDDQLISKLEKLAKLKLTDQEKETLKVDLDKILDMFSTIASVNTDNVEPLRHINAHFNVMRDDKVGKMLALEDVVENAPKIDQNMFAVPKVIE